MPLRPVTESERRRIWSAATACVAERFAEALELDTVAHAAYTSRRQLQRVFAEVGATTFRRHLADVRLAAAAELLARTYLSITQVTAAVGYRQSAQFAQSFRVRYGAGPRLYRTHARAAAMRPDAGVSRDGAA